MHVNDHSWFLEIGAMFRRNIDSGCVLTALERSQVSNDRPTVCHHDVRSVSHHRIFAVGDRVENLAISHLANSVVLQSHDRGEPVLFGDAVTGRGRAMTHRASDTEALPAALHQRRCYFDRNAPAPMIAPFSRVVIIAAAAEGDAWMRFRRFYCCGGRR